MEHTKESWRTTFRGEEDCLDIDADSPLGYPGGATLAIGVNEKDARRIVACVNACAGIDTVTLESLASTGNPTLKNCADALIQRDELLAALKDAAEALWNYGANAGALAADAAIAKAEQS